MVDSSESTAPADETPHPAAKDPQDEQTARILEYAASMDEDDHPYALTEVISLLIQEIHELRPGLQHSSNWLSSESPEIAAIQDARWRGATLRLIQEIGVERALEEVQLDKAHRAQEVHRTDEGESHG